MNDQERKERGERVVRNLLRAIAWDATSCEKEIFDGIMHSDLVPPRSARDAAREWTRVIRANCDKLQRAVRRYMPKTDCTDCEVDE